MNSNELKVFGNTAHKVLMGDALVALENIADNSVDLIFIDPPYNIGKDFNGYKDKWDNSQDYVDWCCKWLQLSINKLKRTGSLYFMTSTQFMPYFDIFLQSRINILSRIVWYYDSSGVQAKNHYGSLYEPILFCVKDKNRYVFNSDDILVEAKTGAKRKLVDYRKTPPQIYNSQKVPGNVWEFARVRYRMDEYENHPTQKPISLLERIIRASSNRGDTVLDPFSGTFTTSFVAKRLGRHSIGIELQEDYVKIGLRRLGLQEEYNGEKLTKGRRTYARGSIGRQSKLTLFDR